MKLLSIYKQMTKWLSIFCALFMLSACVNSQYFVDKGKRKYYAKEYRNAYISLKAGAERNNPEAQYALGYMFYYGQGVTESKQKALYWFHRAAINGHQKAIEALNMIKNEQKK